ncbi:glycosylphosphatidylinositol phospholipase D [Synchytrium microbalum]|uniref:Phosphatidylinositol-glycan-specific phospholipase D n=1 Tax=Synchytrium microbalum TaxID=1806994 RepID=A0A507BY92_9FUNG|nr:glycosylphosphatidylinositol phospholipase D [Synchytrium microbalum]TPX30774.1 glycosylphosphatidylinositol phospholipase D [Synchytrium microbalum]
MSMHLEVTHRATKLFQNNPIYAEILRDYEPYLQAGSFFPDWGYACGSASDESEAAHWLPFWNHTIAYIRKTYPPPLTSNAKALIAFLFGIVSHGAADAPWHSLDSREGFIEVMAEYDFDGVYGDAHAHADPGGDVMLAYEGGLEYFDRVWRIPSLDIVNIYHIAGYTNVTRLQLDECMLIGYTGAQLNRAMGHYLYPGFAAPSPFLVEQYIDYFKGGIVDMTTWVITCWNSTIEWIENGSEGSRFCKMFDDWSFDHVGRRGEGQYVLQNGHGFRTTSMRNVRCINSVISLEDTLLKLSSRFWVKPQRVEHVDITEFKLVSLFAPTAPSENPAKPQSQSQTTEIIPTIRKMIRIIKSYISFIFALGRAAGDVMHEGLMSLFERKPMSCPTAERVETWSIPAPYAAFGNSMVSLEINGRTVLAIGAPYYTMPNSSTSHIGAVFLTLLDKNTSNSRTSDVPYFAMLYGDVSNAGSRFGTSLAIVDLNSDGIPDIAVSAPSHDASKLYYNGRVYVFFGQKQLEGGFSMGQEPDVIIEATQPFPNIPPFKEGTGVGAHYKYRYRFTVLGVALLGADVDGDGYKDLVVGSPFAAYDGGISSQRGVIHAFYSSSNHTGVIDARLNADWFFPSPARIDFERFGSSLAMVDKDILVVGAPGFALLGDKTRGRVYGFKIKKRDQYPVLLWSVAGTGDFGQFGSSITPFTTNNRTMLIISSSSERNPYASSRVLDLPGAAYDYSLRGFQAGSIRVIDTTDLVLRGIGDDDVNDNVTLLTIRGSASSSHLGWKGGVAVGRDGIYLGEMLDNREQEQVHLIPAPTAGTHDSPTRVSTTCWQDKASTSQQQTRFGSNILVMDVDGDGKEDLIVSFEHGGVDFAGSVSVIYG